MKENTSMKRGSGREAQEGQVEKVISESLNAVKEVAQKTIDAIEETARKQVEEALKLQETTLEKVADNLEKEGISRMSPLGTFILELYRNYMEVFSNNIKYFMNLAFEGYRKNTTLFFSTYEAALKKILEYYEIGEENRYALINIWRNILDSWLSEYIKTSQTFASNITKGMEIYFSFTKQYNETLDRQFQVVKEIQDRTFKLIQEWMNWWK